MKKTDKVLSVILVVLMIMQIIPVEAIEEQTTDAVVVENNTLTINGNFDATQIEIPDAVDQIIVNDADINEPLNFIGKSKIIYISFENCKITTKEMGIFISLETVIFDKCTIPSCIFLKDNPNIKTLVFRFCFLASTDGLENLSYLQKLIFRDVGIESIDFIKDFEDLQRLELNRTYVTDLSPIENKNLEYLDVSDSLRIEDLSPVLTLNNLQRFYCCNCEMVFTDELYNFITHNKVDTYMKESGLLIREKIVNIANEIFTENMSEKEKIEATVEYIIDNLEYDYNVEDDYKLLTIYNDYALEYALQGIGCCINYTTLAVCLLQLAGVETWEITNDGHIWNLIRMDGEIYSLDITMLDGLPCEDVLESHYYMRRGVNLDDCSPLMMPVSLYKDIIDAEEKTCESITQEENIYTNNYEHLYYLIIIPIFAIVLIVLVIKRKIRKYPSN